MESADHLPAKTPGGNLLQDKKTTEEEDDRLRCFLAAQAIGHIVRHLDAECLAPFANIDFVLLFLHLIQKHIHPSHAAPPFPRDASPQEKKKEEQEELDVDMLYSPSSSPSKTEFVSKHQRKGEKHHVEKEREEEEREREMRMRVLSLGLEGQREGCEEEEDEREMRERHDLVDVSLGILTETLMKFPQAFELKYRIDIQGKREGGGRGEEDSGKEDVHRHRFFLTILDIVEDFIRSLLVYNPYQNDCYFSEGMMIQTHLHSQADRRQHEAEEAGLSSSLSGGGGRI